MIRYKKVIEIAICTFVLFALAIYIGRDSIAHGYFCSEIALDQIPATDYHDAISLEEGAYDMSFVPQKDHMAGFGIYLTNQPEGNRGTLILTILDGKAKAIDSVEVDLEKVYSETWYYVYTSAELKKGEQYTLRFTARDCVTTPCLQNVSPDYLPDETVSGNILLSYSYAESTFTVQNRIIIIFYILVFWGFICSLMLTGKKRKCIQTICGFLFMTLMLTWNYMYNSMDNQNTMFSDFQSDSEGLVTGVIYAEQKGVYFDNSADYRFGLGHYQDLKGGIVNYELAYFTDNDWLNGYSRTDAAILVQSNYYSRSVAMEGNYVLFDNGEMFRIITSEANGEDLIIRLEADHALSPAKYGSLDDIIFLDPSLTPLPACQLSAYRGQYGLQGKIFKHLARYLDESEAVATLNLLCSFATAAVFVLIVFLLSLKYNKILAGCFFITFWLSPWIVNFARNLYWVEFTWFLPMAVGLFCSWKIHDRKSRLISYILVFVTILGKCLCGYEYITVIMLGMIAFLLTDLIMALIQREKAKFVLLFRTTFIIGIVALIGFITAICIHAVIRGNGNMAEGVKIIFEQDVLRRTSGGDLNVFDPQLWPSFNASVWEVFCKYFHFSTDVIAGITGNLFPLLCTVPLCIFALEYKQKKLDKELLSMYVIFFVTCVSWFILAKSHSYEHGHMNYVLWYFGFVQICLYIIVKKFVDILRK